MGNAPLVSPMQRVLEDLFRHNRIVLRRGALFDCTPGALPLEDLRIQQRIEGLLIGLAVGDALGHATEWQYDPERRHREFGTIVDHVGPAWTTPGRISDDTQLSFWTVECLLTHGAFDFDALVAWFVERRNRIVGGGRNTAGALARHAERLRGGAPPLHACPGDPSGRTRQRVRHAVLAVAPPASAAAVPATLGRRGVGDLCHARPSGGDGGHAGLRPSAVGDPAAAARRGPGTEWWLDEFVHVARELEAIPLPFVLGGDSVPSYFRGFDGYLWEFIDTQVRQAWQRGVSVRDACSLAGFGSGPTVFRACRPCCTF